MGMMSYKEFLRFEREVRREEMDVDCFDTLSFGAARAQRRIDQLQKLIALSHEVDSKTLASKRLQWERQIAKLNRSAQQFQLLKQENLQKDSKLIESRI